MAASGLFCLALAMPLRAHQVADFIRPYAKARQIITGSKADVVFVDSRGLWYGDDLVRNDPFLEQGPKVMHLSLLTGLQIRQLCAAHSVALFAYAQGKAVGITTYSPAPDLGDKRVLLRSLHCGAPL